MSSRTRWTKTGLPTACASGASVASVASVAWGMVFPFASHTLAQQQDGFSPTTSPSARMANNARPVSVVLAEIGKAAGVAIVADSTVAAVRVAAPAGAATTDTVEQQIAGVVQALPRGTTWLKLYLPPPAQGRPWNGDDLAAYAKAQARLYGPLRQPSGTAAGMVEILGQKIPAEQARGAIAALNLTPVYLVTNPTFGAAGEMVDWSQMTQEQRRAAARLAAERILNMDPALRSQYLQQHMMTFETVMRQLPPDQHDDLLRSMGAEVIRTPDGNVRVRRELGR